MLADAPFILHGWLRSGNTGAARGVVPFLQEALTLLPEGMWLRTVRADSGFLDGVFLDFLEERALPYVVVARLGTYTSRFNRRPKGDGEKVAVAARLRAETTMTVGWIAERLEMGTRGHHNHLLYRQRKRGTE